MRFILGSQSPRRREILSYFSLPFEQINPQFDEEALVFQGNPEQYVRELARGKALSLVSSYPEATILTADTIVFREGKLYGKPKDEKEAFTTLSELSGNWHSVYTAVAVAHLESLYDDIAETKVLFNSLSEQEINRYIEALHWADKAGGYAIQLAGSLIVKRIEGCYYNVVGLPITNVSNLLRKIGINLWDYLK